MEKINTWLEQHPFLLAAYLAFCAIAISTVVILSFFKDDFLTSYSVALIAIFVVIPILPKLSKLKIGELEMEFKTQEELNEKDIRDATSAELVESIKGELGEKELAMIEGKVSSKPIRYFNELLSKLSAAVADKAGQPQSENLPIRSTATNKANFKPDQSKGVETLTPIIKRIAGGSKIKSGDAITLAVCAEKLISSLKEQD